MLQFLNKKMDFQSHGLGSVGITTNCKLIQSKTLPIVKKSYRVQTMNECWCKITSHLGSVPNHSLGPWVTKKYHLQKNDYLNQENSIAKLSSFKFSLKPTRSFLVIPPQKRMALFGSKVSYHGPNHQAYAILKLLRMGHTDHANPVAEKEPLSFPQNSTRKKMRCYLFIAESQSCFKLISLFSTHLTDIF